jgi:hypothetical protein
MVPAVQVFEQKLLIIPGNDYLTAQPIKRKY